MGFSRQEYWSGLPLPSPTERHLPTNDEMMYHQLKRFVQLSVPETKKKKKLLSKLFIQTVKNKVHLELSLTIVAGCIKFG